ncbi:MAG: tetratricopeptide repeat protein [Acidobacteria bacterium]|nr:tetratricopeptide repeat protein [Acidobacteriota bacterium]MBI3657711.1 tetratricopeptide repeat protein [Acidobacteriota bacterium]
MCPTAEQWYDYLHDLLDESRRADMEGHKARCSSCGQILDDLNQAAKLLDYATRAQGFPDYGYLSAEDHCPDPQTLTEMLAGSLSELETENVYAHLAQCTRCRDVWLDLKDLWQAAQSEEIPIPSESKRRQGFQEALAAASPTSVPPPSVISRWFFSILEARFFKPVFALALLLAVGVLSWFYYTSYEARKWLAEGNKALYASFENIRPSDLRLSGQFDWVPRQTRGVPAASERGRLDEARKALEHARALTPRDPEIHHALGRLYLASRDLGQAEEYLARAEKLDRRSAAIQNDLGCLAYQQEDFTRAARCFKRAMELDLQFLAPVFNAAWLELHLGHLKEAEALINTYRRLDTTPGSFWVQDLQDELARIRH